MVRREGFYDVPMQSLFDRYNLLRKVYISHKHIVCDTLIPMPKHNVPNMITQLGLLVVLMAIALEVFDESACGWQMDQGRIKHDGVSQALFLGRRHRVDGPAVGSISILDNAVRPLESRRIGGALRDTESL